MENRAESRYESDTRLLQRFQETFERETHGERAATYAQMMSFEDSTIRIMGTLFR